MSESLNEEMDCLEIFAEVLVSVGLDALLAGIYPLLHMSYHLTLRGPSPCPRWEMDCVEILIEEIAGIVVFLASLSTLLAETYPNSVVLHIWRFTRADRKTLTVPR